MSGRESKKREIKFLVPLDELELVGEVEELALAEIPARVDLILSEVEPLVGEEEGAALDVEPPPVGEVEGAASGHHQSERKKEWL